MGLRSRERIRQPLDDPREPGWAGVTAGEQHGSVESTQRFQIEGRPLGIGLLVQKRQGISDERLTHRLGKLLPAARARTQRLSTNRRAPPAASPPRRSPRIRSILSWSGAMVGCNSGSPVTTSINAISPPSRLTRYSVARSIVTTTVEPFGRGRRTTGSAGPAGPNAFAPTPLPIR